MLRAVLLFTVCVVSATPVTDHLTPRDGERCGYESCPRSEEGVLNVHIVPHTHDDVGWLKTVDEYYYGSKNNIQKAGVQYILDSVVKELWEDPKRRFIYVETAFFWKWWVRQSGAVRDRVHALVRQGRLQFVGGAWSMNDEAATHYQSTVDQFTWGLKKLNDTFGRCGLPRVGWQIDPFGHSREFASLLAAMGYDGLFLGRIDYQDKRARLTEKRMEMLWRGDDDLGKQSDIFTGVLYNTYSPPPGFCFDVLCSDEPIIDDPESPKYNVEKRVQEFIDKMRNYSSSYKTNHVLVTMGDDFNYQDANMWFRNLDSLIQSNNVIITMGGDFTYQDATMWYSNLDKLIEYTNLKSAKEGLNMKLFYSTPNCYLKSVKEANPTLPTKQDDFFPYASDPTAFWTGYFTSRPTTKYFEREGNNYLQAMKQLQVLAGLETHNIFVLDELKSAMGVMQHHDAVTGTEKQEVTYDYERILDQAISDSMLIANQAFNKQIRSYTLDPPLLQYERCHFNESRCKVSENSKQFVVTVYNPLSWSLPAVPVRLPVKNANYDVVAPNGEAIEYQLVELPSQVLKIPTRNSVATHEVVFLAYDVPGMGFKSFYVKEKTKISKRDVKSQIQKHIAQLNEYYDSINRYWNDIKQTSYVDLNSIEDAHERTRSLNTRKSENEAEIPENPIVENPSPNVYLFINKDKFKRNSNQYRRDVNIDLLKDKNYNNKDIEELDALIKEVRRELEKVKNNPPKREVDKVGFPSLNDDEMRMLSDEPAVMERHSDDDSLGNEQVRLHINNTTGRITHIVLKDGTETQFDIKMLYYPGCVGDNSNTAKRSSGAYIFRPNATKPLELFQNTSNIIKGNVVDEYHYTLSDYASGVTRIYKHDQLNYVENEWLVGPIPVEDDIGKEVVVQYITDIINNGEFYTDSNGRQMLKRKLNERPQWNLTLEEPVGGNYYPVTNKIYIENEKRASILTDRAQGGSSLEEGVIELMLHRRLLHDDAFGVDEALNEVAKGTGLVVRGKHKIILSKVDNKNSLIEEKKKVIESHLSPIVFLSDAKSLSLDIWLTLKKKVGGINTVPDGIHVLTVEPWNSKLLLRLENYLEKSDKSDTDIDVDLAKIFANLKINKFDETTLSANQWLDNYIKWNWNAEHRFAEKFNDAYARFDNVTRADDEYAEADDNGTIVQLKAKQIRTFIVDYEL